MLQTNQKWELKRYEVVGTIFATSDKDAEDSFQEKFGSTNTADLLVIGGWTLGDIVSVFLRKGEQGFDLYEVTLTFV